jgi:hypothetical protein
MAEIEADWAFVACGGGAHCTLLSLHHSSPLQDAIVSTCAVVAATGAGHCSVLRPSGRALFVRRMAFTPTPTNITRRWLTVADPAPAMFDPALVPAEAFDSR